MEINTEKYVVGSPVVLGTPQAEQAEEYLKNLASEFYETLHSD